MRDQCATELVAQLRDGTVRRRREASAEWRPDAFRAEFGARAVVAVRVPSEYLGVTLMAVDVAGGASDASDLVSAVAERIGDALEGS